MVFEPSHQVGEEISKYQIVPPSYFACNLLHVGRDKVLSIAYNQNQKGKIVSPTIYGFFRSKITMGPLIIYFF